MRMELKRGRACTVMINEAMSHAYHVIDPQLSTGWYRTNEERAGNRSPYPDATDF
jgi:hypothetical protein